MKIAILGATSQIAKDLIISFRKYSPEFTVFMFSRSPEKVEHQFQQLKENIEYPNFSYDEFGKHHYDVIINFVGVGDPAKALVMGSDIFSITEQYDSLALNYLSKKPQTKYIFLSSGAVFGGDYKQPIDGATKSIVDINNFKHTDWYAVSKLYTEAKHRAFQDYSIVDIRVFNYFSSTQSIESRFLIADIVRAIRDKEILVTSKVDFFRDFLHPIDFFQLIMKVIEVEKTNMALDCYTKKPIEKLELLKECSSRFGLDYQFVQNAGVNATGSKLCYYSTNHIAHALGYKPLYTSLSCVMENIEIIIS